MNQRMLLWVIILFAVSACEHKDLCYDHPHKVSTQVVFDWRKAPDASPKSMSLYLFPTNGAPALRYEFTNYKGGLISVPPGNYNALCLNGDTEAVLLRNTDKRETFEAYTREASLLESLGLPTTTVPRPEGTEDEQVVLAPDMLWSDRADNISLIESEQGQVITLYPEESVSTYTYEIRNVNHLEYASAFSGSLSGLSGSLMLGSNQVAEGKFTVPFAADSDGVSSITGKFQIFGHGPSTIHKHLLVIYAILTDNSKVYHTYDVTDQIHSAVNPRRVHLILDGFTLPKPEGGNGGFNPDVDDWEQIDIDINM